MGCACGSAALREAAGGAAGPPPSREAFQAPPSQPSRPPRTRQGPAAQFCGHCSQPLEGRAKCPSCGWRDPARIEDNCQKCKACSTTGLNFCPNCGAACWVRLKRRGPDATPLSEEALAVADNPWPRGDALCIGCSTRVDYRFCAGCGKEDRTNSQTLQVKRSWSNTLVETSMAQLQGSHQQQLDQILASKPYLTKPDHFLNFYVDMCAAAIADGDEEETQNALDHLTMVVDNEERTIAVAFRMFDKDRSCKLDVEELQFMLQYIGFPSSPDDAEGLMERIDKDKDRLVSFEEFLDYVGEMGGVSNLYRGRREQIESKSFGGGGGGRRSYRSSRSRSSGSLESAQNSNGALSRASSRGLSESSRPLNGTLTRGNSRLSDAGSAASMPLSLAASSQSLPTSALSRRSLTSQASTDSLRSCGFKDDASTAWGLVVDPSELEAMALLQPCQQLAIKHIRAVAQENHERALPYLQRRAVDLGFTDGDLHIALLWVRDLADIICHVKLEKVGPAILSDTHYRNQFETNTSSGFLKHDSRRKWERVLFGPAYDGVDGFHRPKYGVQNILNDYRGVLGCKQYGDSYIVLRGVRLRCTCSAQDSALLPARRLAVLDFYSSALQEYSDKELAALLQVAKGGGELVGDSLAVVERWGRYKEVQVHGEIRWDTHVSALVVNDRHRGDPLVERIREKEYFPVFFMDDMKDKMVRRASKLQSRTSGVFESLYENSQGSRSSTTSI